MVGQRSTEGQAIEALRRLVKRYAGVLALVGAAAGTWAEARYRLLSAEEALHRLRKDADDRWSECVSRRGIGPDGFIDPQVRAGLDLHVSRLLQIERDRAARDMARWRRQFADLNPGTKLPSE